MDITVFLGAPGSGKGTQAKRLAEAGSFAHLSTGDILRAAIQNGTPVGKRAQSFVDQGDLVPDNIMIELIEDTLHNLSGPSKILLDGFPRTLAQAHALDGNSKTSVARALYFKVPENVLVERLTGRRICEKCGESFHVVFMPPKHDSICDKCGSKLYQRSDDNENVVSKRLEVYKNQTQPLLAYYDAEKKLSQLDGNQPAETIQRDITRLLDSNG